VVGGAGLGMWSGVLCGSSSRRVGAGDLLASWCFLRFTRVMRDWAVITIVRFDLQGVGLMFLRCGWLCGDVETGWARPGF